MQAEEYEMAAVAYPEEIMKPFNGLWHDNYP